MYKSVNGTTYHSDPGCAGITATQTEHPSTPCDDRLRPRRLKDAIIPCMGIITQHEYNYYSQYCTCTARACIIQDRNLLIDAVRGTNLSRVLVTDVTSNSLQLQGQFDHVDEGTTMLAFS